MEPTMTLATALTTGLVQLGGIVADKVVEYVGAEPISTQIKNRLRKREQDKLLLTAVQSGLNEIDALANNGDMLLGWRMQLHDLTAKNEDALRQLMARHVISYVSDSEPVPPELVKALKWPDSHLSKLKKLLLTLRQALAADEEWQHVLAYANQVTSVQRIELVTKQLDSVITETLEGTAVRVIQVEDKPDAAKILKPYFDWVQRQCTRLSLSPLDPTQQESGHFGLGQVFINLNSGSLKPNGEHAMRLQLEQGRMPRPHAALANIHANPQIVLLGDPGSGKSTLLRYLALCLSNALIWPEANWLQKLSWKVGFIDETAASNESTAETRHWTHAKLIPVTVTLRDFAQSTFTASDPTAIFDFIVEHLCANDLEATVELLRSEAQAGRVIFLLDGVDEVPIGRRSAVWQAIGSLTNGVYGRCRWVVTCRVLSFVASEMPRKWPVQTLQPLNQEQIDTFVTSWFYGLVDAGEIPKQDAPQKSGALQQATRRKKLQPLAQNPMLLTIMALVQTFHGTLPNARAKLYQTCVETLLLRWQRHKEQGGGAALPNVLEKLGTNEQKLERLLWEIGYVAHSQAAERDQAADIKESEVVAIAKRHLGNYAKAEAFIEYTERRAHLLVGRGGEDEHERIYTFPHRTFQEYLAACYLASQRRWGYRAIELAELGDGWREVLNLAIGTLVFNQNNIEKAFDGIQRLLPNSIISRDNIGGWRRVWLAGEMCAMIGRKETEKDEVGQKLLPDLLKQLQALIRHSSLSSIQRFEAAKALDALGWLPDDLNHWICCTNCASDGGDLLAGKYLVTNAQYALFIAADGYEDASLWGGTSSKAWQEKSRHKWCEPRHWHSDMFGKERRGFPVVSVSWYEAQAYCAWLTRLVEQVQANGTIKDEERVLVADLVSAGVAEVRLPHDEEWVMMAGGVEGNRYPWDVAGGPVTSKDDTEFIVARANVSESKIGRTSPVTLYPNGASTPFGLMDMAGNVWEWSNTVRNDGRYRLRGGAWSYSTVGARVAARIDFNPNYSYSNIGFRVVASVVSGS